MTVYAVFCPARNAYIGTHFYVSDKPKLFHSKGAATNKANRMFRIFGEVCEVHVFDLVLRTV